MVIEKRKEILRIMAHRERAGCYILLVIIVIENLNLTVIENLNLTVIGMLNYSQIACRVYR